MAKDLDGTGVTVNVSVPGGVTNTPMISDAAGVDRTKLIQPEVMRHLSFGSSPMLRGKSPVGGFSPCIGTPSCGRKKRPRRLEHRSRGQALRQCRLRRAGLSAI
jgi:hypothetical protein